MAIKKKKAVEKLKNQDRQLAKLPSLDKEKKVFSKGESVLSRLIRRKKVKEPIKKSKQTKKKKLRIKD